MTTPLTLDALQFLPLYDRTRAFIAWLRSQPADATYLPGTFHGCALAQFGATVGMPRGGCREIMTATAGAFTEIIPVAISVGRWTERDYSTSLDGIDGEPTSFHAFADHLDAELARLESGGSS